MNIKTLNRILLLLAIHGCFCALNAQENFRVWPYLQNPDSDAMSIIWFSESAASGSLAYRVLGSEPYMTEDSKPEISESLAYSTWEDTTFFGGEAPLPPYKHRIRLENLLARTTYEYTVSQGTDTFHSSFVTAPSGVDSIRFIVYGDSETEPESTGSFTSWPDPLTGDSRFYLVDQTTGYRNNLKVIKSRSPDLVLIAGDLTQHGGEQRDWDEFWKHNADSSGSTTLAGQVPVMAAPGNHDYYEGNYLDDYNQPGSERAIKRYLTYFDPPANHSPNKEQEGRYYHLKYGQVSLISLDLCNNGTNGNDEDTNFYLLGESDPGGGNAPDFGMGSVQYSWLEDQLKEAQEKSVFTFVIFHHMPYSSGPHGFPVGVGDLMDDQSGVATRVLTPLFLRYGVDAVFCGHDEMWERSEVSGIEVLPDGEELDHYLTFIDVGVGGDGLRGPVDGADNVYQQFLVHTDAPEKWEGDRLVEGGKHYGHLEVDIIPIDEFSHQAILTPVYVLPLYSETDSAYTGFERRVYKDQILLTRTFTDTTVGKEALEETFSATHIYPNPFYTQTRIEYWLPEAGNSKVSIWDNQGRLIRILRDRHCMAGSNSLLWEGEDGEGNRVSPGLYLYRIETETGAILSGRMICLDP